MIGKTLAARPGPPIGAMLWAVAAVVSAALAVLFEITALFAAAAIFGVIAITLLASRERPFAARLDESGISLLHTGEFVPYAKIESLAAGPSLSAKNPHQYAIDLHTAKATVRVPAAIDVATPDLERFLRSHLPPRIVAVPDPDVDEFLNRQIEQFGAQQVFWSGPARDPANLTRVSVRRAWLACLLAGVVVLIVGVAMLESRDRGPGNRRDLDHYTGVIVVGAVSLIVGLLGLLIHISLTRRSHPKLKNFELSSLVVSPLGIALRQGDLKGELKWEEIRGIKLPRNKPLSLQLAASRSRSSISTTARSSKSRNACARWGGCRGKLTEGNDRPKCAPQSAAF
jgi:hypothetical protein